MLDGSTEITDLDKTEENRNLIRSFVEEVFLNDQLSALNHYIDSENYVEHNPKISDGLPALRKALSREDVSRDYETIHRLLAEGNFVLSVCEGHLNGLKSCESIWLGASLETSSSPHLAGVLLL